MRSTLTLVLALLLAAPAAASSTAPTPAPGRTVEPVATTDGEVRPTFVDRLVFLVADLQVRVERAGEALEQAVEEQRYASVAIAEPDYGGVGEDSVRIAAAITGRPVGGSLDAGTATELVAAAEDELAPALALAGVSDLTLNRDGLVAAADALGVDLGDSPFDATVLNQLRSASDATLIPALVSLGRDPGQRVSRQDLQQVLAPLGIPSETLDGSTLARVVAEARFRLAPLAYATGKRDGSLVTREGIGEALRAVGVDYGTTVGVDDVAAGIRAAGHRLALSAAKKLGGSLTYQRLYAPTSGGPIAGHLLRWRTGPDGGIDLRTGFAGSFQTRASIPSAAQRTPDALAVINGGYWALGGDPDGLLVSEGRLLSSRETLRDWVRGVRAGFGVTKDGRAVVGSPDITLGVDVRGRSLEVAGVDRPVGSDELVLYTHSEYLRTLPSDTVTVAFPGPGSLLRSSRTSFRVDPQGPRTGVPGGQLVLAARGRAADLLRSGTGTNAELQVRVGDGWAGIDDGISGGPWLLRDGVVPDVEEWRTEGFGAGHTDGRHPRTAIGFDDAGTAFLLTVDGRQPGYSVGLSHRDMGELMASLGATDAVMLDGGGSSQMVVGGDLVNRPCCDRNTRPVATAVYLYPEV